MCSQINQKECLGIILGAGKPYKGINPSALRSVGGTRRVMDWQLDALSPACDDIQFVAGYDVHSITEQYPNVSYILNDDWQVTKSIGSLLKARMSRSSSYIISYGDIVFFEQDVSEIRKNSQNCIVFSVGKIPKEGARSDLEAITLSDVKCINSNKKLNDTFYFVGLVYVPQALHGVFTSFMQDNKETLKKHHLGTLINELVKHDFPVKAYDISGRWCDLNKPGQLAKFLMGSKAETLARIQKVVKCSKIPKQVSFSCRDYNADQQTVISKILSEFPGELLAVRSSSQAEDSFEQANAGAFHSELNVKPDKKSLHVAIEKVVEPMPCPEGSDHVFVQPMVKDVIASGVIFTRLLHNGAPYYRVNYDIGSDTASVTSGAAEDLRCALILKNKNSFESEKAPWIKKLLVAAEELEDLLDIDYLDIEFAIDKNHDVFILQSRPLVLQEQPSSQIDVEVFERISQATKRFKELGTALPGVLGKHHGFGVMPDWNPAEIIGTYPSALASSLYAYLIMDNVWAKQRAEFGYRDIRPAPLLRLFCGQPYVDIRASLNSFVPKDISQKMAEEIIDLSMVCLRDNPHFHDKIEFQVIPTCYDFNFSRWKGLQKYGASANLDMQELKSSYLSLTNRALSRIDKDFSEIENINNDFQKNSQKPFGSGLDKAMALLEICKNTGTINFSHMARHGFIAVILLKSAAEAGVISPSRIEEFLLSIKTVSTEYQEDSYSVANGEISRDELIAKYGHLRPGSYDLLSKRYDEDIEFYFNATIDNAKPYKHNDFKWSDDEERSWNKVLKEHGFEITFEEFDLYCRLAISGREKSKFVFTKFLSAALQEFVKFGDEMSLTREELCFIPYSEWKNLANGVIYPNDLSSYLKKCSERYQKEFYLTQKIELPPLIFKESDFSSFEIGVEQANFVTSLQLKAEIVCLDDVDNRPDLEGKIVCIHAADPGYDWLFGHDIAGLITKFGGANSHMAIRAAEFGLPAAIGVGLAKFQEISQARVLDLNCRTQQITIIE